MRVNDRVRRIVRRVTSPRRLMSVAVIAAALGLVVSYVEIQNRADLALALRQGPPQPVAVGVFQARSHVGPVGEIMVQGEIGMDLAQILEVTGPEAQKRVWLAPLFPLSAVGAALVNGVEETGAVTLSAQVARRAPEVAGTAAPRGYVLWWLDDTALPPGAAETIAVTHFGRGSHGAVVALNGRLVEEAQLAPEITEGLAAMGLPPGVDPVGVAPYPSGREAALRADPGQSLKRPLYWLAAVFAALAILEQLRRRFGGARKADVPAPVTEEEAVVQWHPDFAPLTSQSELARSDEAMEEVGRPGLIDRLKNARSRFRNPR